MQQLNREHLQWTNKTITTNLDHNSVSRQIYTPCQSCCTNKNLKQKIIKMRKYVSENPNVLNYEWKLNEHYLQESIREKPLSQTSIST